MDLSRSDFALLSALNALLEARGVSAAARRLNVSQPAMSAQLSRLRDLFDDPLLVGNAHGMALTPLAEKIAPRLAAGVAELTGLVRESAPFDAEKDDRTFVITSTDQIFAASLMPVIQDLSIKAPSIRFAMNGIDQTNNDQENSDLLVATPTFIEPNFRQTKLYSESFVVVARKGHPAMMGKLDLDTFCAETHALVSPKSASFLGPIDQALANVGRSRKVQFSFPSFLLALYAVRDSDMIAVLPRRLARRHSADLELGELPFESPRFDVLISWHPRMQKDLGHIWLRNQIIDRVRTRTRKNR